MAEEKEHVERINKEFKFNRQRAGTDVLRANCVSGFVFTRNEGAAGQSAFHHILAISSLQDGNIRPEANLEFYRDCMAITEWDINDRDNLIGLPLKPVYENADRYATAPTLSWIPGMADLTGTLGAFGSIPDLPCHQNEHDDYNNAQVQDLSKYIWKPLARAKKKCTVDRKNILNELQRATSAWRQFLTNRGRGAADCWRNRNRPEYHDSWYIPFSMNPGIPQKAEPPPPLDKRNGTIDQWLETLFNTIH